jgi:hypothetical protein
MCAAASSPFGLGVSTFAAEAQVPLVSVTINETVFNAHVNPSNSVKVWLNNLKPSTVLEPAFVSLGPLNPASAVPVRPLIVQVVALMFTSTTPLSPNKSLVAAVKVMVATFGLVRSTSTVPKGLGNPEIAELPTFRVLVKVPRMLLAEAIEAPSVRTTTASTTIRILMIFSLTEIVFLRLDDELAKSNFPVLLSTDRN